MANKKNNVDNNNEVLQENIDINNENSLKVNDLVVEKQQEIDALKKQVIDALKKQVNQLEQQNQSLQENINTLKKDIDILEKQQDKSIKDKAIIIDTINNNFNGLMFNVDKKVIRIASNVEAIAKAKATKAIPEGIRNNDIIVVHLQSEKVANEINKAENNENKRNYLRYLKPVIFVKDDIR